ncbi:MAG: DUF5110 domain-containing protein [Abditibacteriota bacterium]|nr:DUF5110 domain-containing protein [Abditibacteriota bacterium]
MKMIKTAVLLIIAIILFSCACHAKQPREIYPGVWKITLGSPEKHVPSKYAFKPPVKDALSGQSRQKLPGIFRELRFSSDKKGSRIIFPMFEGEHFYGLGLNTNIFEKKDGRYFVAPADNPEGREGYSHQPVPFLVSTAGYGILLDTARFTGWYIRSQHPKDLSRDSLVLSGADSSIFSPLASSGRYISVDIPVAKGVDVYIFAGDGLKNAVERYNLYSGGGPVPPLWGLGIQYRGCKDLNAEEHLRLIQEIKEDGFPLSMWGLEPGWMNKAYSCDFTWNKQMFPDPEGFTDKLKQQDLHLVLWQHCFVDIDSPIREPLGPLSGDYYVWGGLVPDFSLKKARDIFSSHMDKYIFCYGSVGGMKLDECDYQPSGGFQWSFPVITRFPSGIDGEQMHTLLGDLYMQTILGSLDRRGLRSWNLARNACAFCAPLPFSIYTDAYTYECYVNGMAQSGFCGSMWNPEVRSAGNKTDLLRRMELCLFAPLYNLDIWFMPLPPWKQPNEKDNINGIVAPNAPELTAAALKIARQRMSFVPYLYSAFMDYHTKGTPPVRALVMDYPDDPAVYGISDQFLAGDRIMCAPCRRESEERDVYFPVGDDWADFYTGEVYRGGSTRRLSYPVGTLPIFVKNNSLLPLAEPMENILPDTVFDIEVKKFGTGERGFTLYEDDGISFDFEKGNINKVVLTYEDGKVKAVREGGYAGERYRIGK